MKEHTSVGERYFVVLRPTNAQATKKKGLMHPLCLALSMYLSDIRVKGVLSRKGIFMMTKTHHPSFSISTTKNSSNSCSTRCFSFPAFCLFLYSFSIPTRSPLSASSSNNRLFPYQGRHKKEPPFQRTDNATS